ncbi:MAG: hypothetical protein J1F40_09575 [Prevotellaceae bacterium]|nr:hypothetical protein [Prevotellaceae bacterium]
MALVSPVLEYRQIFTHRSKQFREFTSLGVNKMTCVIRVNETLSKEDWDGIVAHFRKYSNELTQHGGNVQKILLKIK